MLDPSRLGISTGGWFTNATYRTQLITVGHVFQAYGPSGHTFE